MRHGDVDPNVGDAGEGPPITNGVHAATWTAPSVRELFDRHIPGWRENNQSLRYITYTPSRKIEHAHLDAKRALLSYVETVNGVKLDENRFTIGFARRATAYKRADLLFEDIDRLNRIASDIGPIQIIYAGKAHPQDSRGKEIIRSPSPKPGWRKYAGAPISRPDSGSKWVRSDIRKRCDPSKPRRSSARPLTAHGSK